MLPVEECNINKKLKLEHYMVEEIITSTNIKNESELERCDLCKQFLNSVLRYGGHPNYSLSEYIALTDDKLSLFTGNEETFNAEDIPTNHITNFTIYDKNNHLCPFDTGLIEKGVELFVSGFIKPIYDENTSPENGVPAHDIGPIIEWWMGGFDGGEKLPVGITTHIGHYYLMEPSLDYEPICSNIKEKLILTKYVIEFVIDHAWENPKYEDLVENIEGSGEYKDVEDLLFQSAQFICDQIMNIDKDDDGDERPLISIPCMRSLIQLAGVEFDISKKYKQHPINRIPKLRKNIMTKAVTTKLVCDVFEQFFPNQIDDKKEGKGPKKKRCGVCETCQNFHCGVCNFCKDMRRFGGPGKLKQACERRRCLQMAVMDAEISDNEEENIKDEKKIKKVAHVSNKIVHNVKWKDKIDQMYKGNQCYSSAIINDEFTVTIGDYVMLKSQDPKKPLCIAKVIYMFDSLPQKFKFHGLLMCRGTNTILGETSDPRELFADDNCDDLLLGTVIRKAEVNFRKIPENWAELGGTLNLEEPSEDDGKTFFFTKRFENNRFEDVDFHHEFNIEGCVSCRRKSITKKLNSPVLVGSCIKWKNEDYKVGSGILMKSSVYKFDNYPLPDLDKKKIVDENIYPEFYRKTDTIKGSNDNTVNPFVIGMIEDIVEPKGKEIKIAVRIFFRPEHTKSLYASYTKDLNYLYYSDEVINVSFENVVGKCYLAYEYNFESASEWSDQGPLRFYFSESYSASKLRVIDLPTNARNIGIIGKGKGGGKIKGRAKQTVDSTEIPPAWITIDAPLRCMDVFAGCGGLSEGLKMSKIADSRWAIEKEVPAANAFKLNNPDCKVFINDCNDLLRLIINNRAKEKELPEKGEVELLVGGPPCQGFSGMNRFNSRDYSSFKNSLVVSLLSFCEYYRPKYFILENVRNFVSFKRSMVLKLTLRCLLAMGYQVTFGVLQAGQYGIPQTRRRLILMAAAPGYVLPKYPEPLHVFNKKGTSLIVTVDGYVYDNGCSWTESAPYRTITVRDALSDLPGIASGFNKQEIPYDSEPTSHFQRIMRGKEDNGLVKDHICKEMSCLVLARMTHIPTYAGADWRDLPNIHISLPDGTTTNKLNYPFRTRKQKPNDTPRGVCQCVLGKECDPADKQVNTLIPWCLPHTGDRHNHWAGLYGRLEWDGYFGTTITNPEPMGKQGRVLHPEQPRVVGVRECARSQGFKDKFRFCGNLLDKYRQVGNAVPPPLGLAIGKEIVKALLLSKQDKYA